MKLYKYIIIIALGVWNGSYAQGIHFSDPEQFKSFFNPAQTGAAIDQWKAGLQHRNQWTTIGEGFQTSALYLERQKNRFGIGSQIFQNKAGVGHIKTLSGNGSFSYSQTLSGNSFLRGGASLGFRQMSFDPSMMTFDEQFVEGRGFDESLNNGEQFTNTKNMIITGSAGLLYKRTFGKDLYRTRFGGRKMKLTLGAAIHNPHQPQEGFQTEAVLPMKQVFHGKLEIPINPKSRLTPRLFYQKQGVQKELLAGAGFERSVNEDCEVEVGLANRSKDAWIFSGAIRWGNTKLLMSYDYTTSNLGAAVNNRGAIEIGLQMNFGLPKRVRDRSSTKGISKSIPTPDTNQKNINEKKFFQDTDNDGVKDMDDHCPHLSGNFRNNGCPDGFKDMDRDGVPDDKDFCIHIKGSAEFNGCPDTDGDGVSDIDDNCPYLKGTRELNGCPE